jgi:hypothetical protein
MHVAQFDTHVLVYSENMYSQRGLVGKVHRVRPGWDTVVSEQRSAGELKIWRYAPVALEVPLQAERVKSSAVGSVGRLKDEKDRNSIDRVFESASEKTRQMRPSQDPSVAQSSVEGAGISPSASDGVSPTGPYLDFVPSSFRPDLGVQQIRSDEDQKS